MPFNDQIWDRVFATSQGDLPVEVARYFLTLSISDDDKSKYQTLAEKEQTELSIEERRELERLVTVNNLLMLLQAKARLSLKERQPAA